MNTILCEQYEKKVRPCIDLINSLRELGVEKDLTLPAIVVIGDQSSGKSSVLEALSGVALPRGNGLVTRCPLELKMKKSGTRDAWHGKIKYNDYEKEITDPKTVEKIIKKAQNEIAGAIGISDELISLEVTSANVPDLTLIDLPGIVRIPVRGQSEDVGEQSKNLIEKFIKNSDSIILVVVPCNVDIATIEALKMTQKVDPQGKRTLGILTKPDLVDQGMEEMVVSIINNEIIPLNKGYMIVRCRGQQEIRDDVRLDEAIMREKIFFTDHPYYSMLYENGKATIPILAEKLTLELVSHIKQSLPHLTEKIQRKLTETQAELDWYDSGPPMEPAQRTIYLTDKIIKFNQDTLSLTDGEGPNRNVSIFSRLRKEFSEWKDDLDKSEITFNKKIEKELQEYEERYRGNELPGFLNYMTFKAIVMNQIKQLEEPAIRRLKEISDLIENELNQLAHSNFLQFPNLLKITKCKSENIIKVKESEAKSMLKTHFKMEMMIYTQDGIYKNNLQQLRDTEEENERMNYGVARPPRSTLSSYSNFEDTLEELMCHLKSYYSIVRNRLADQVPMVIRYMVLHESAVQLQREMIQLMKEESIDKLLKEMDDVSSKRNNLIEQKKRLREAQKKLTMF